MKESTKEGYVASGVILFVGIIFGYVWFTGGKDGLIGTISLILSLLGVSGILKPDLIGQILDHWLRK